MSAWWLAARGREHGAWRPAAREDVGGHGGSGGGHDLGRRGVGHLNLVLHTISADVTRRVAGAVFFLASLSLLSFTRRRLVLPWAHDSGHDPGRRGAVAVAGAPQQPRGPVDFFCFFFHL
jgi:hypothetical protein